MSKQDSRKLEQKILYKNISEYKAIVAIDFGTDGSGLAYCKIETETKTDTIIENEINIVDWGGDSQAINAKTKTCILIPSDNSNDNNPGSNDNAVRFGNDAIEHFLNVNESTPGNVEGKSNDIDGDNDSSDDDELFEAKPMLFQKFKMKLWEQEIQGKAKAQKVKGKLDIRDQIKSEDNRFVPTDQVFKFALKFMKDKVFETLTGAGIISNNDPKWTDDVKWVLTVPAIWSERSKFKMQQWAIQAGLVSARIHEHLLIVYEPECASIDVKYNMAQVGERFKAGERYILLDTGGGTVDIAFHSVNSDGKMDEFHHPDGGPYGSTYVDEEFINLLEKLFTKDKIDTFNQFFSKNMVLLKKEFIKSKEKFWGNKNINYSDDSKIDESADDKLFHSINFSAFECDTITAYLENELGFEEEFWEALGMYLENNIPNEYKGEIKLDEDKLLLSHKIWKQLFDYCIDNIIKIVNRCVNEVTDRHTKPIQYMCLVGGFAESPYYVYKIHKEFSAKYSIKKPDKPLLSVVRGAVRRGLFENIYISSRKMMKTYGIAVDRSKDKVENSDYAKHLPTDYIKDNTYIHPITKVATVKNLFSIFVAKSSSVSVNDKIRKTYSRFSKREKRLQICIYDSDKANPVITQGKPLTKGIIEFPPTFEGKKFKVDFEFGKTMISAVAILDDHHRVPLKFQYDFRDVF